MQQTPHTAAAIDGSLNGDSHGVLSLRERAKKCAWHQSNHPLTTPTSRHGSTQCYPGSTAGKVTRATCQTEPGNLTSWAVTPVATTSNPHHGILEKEVNQIFGS